MIRKHTPEDLESIMDIWLQSSSLAHPFLNSTFAEKVNFDMRTMYIPNSETWVYIKNNIIVGFISMIGNEIGGLFVLPKQHSKGIGTQLVNYINSFHEEIEVEVFKKNVIGRSFYNKYGFKLKNTYYHVLSNEDVMRLKLSK